MNGLKHQQGAALIFALVFLLMLTLIGVTASKVTGLEERMAGNTRERDLAFEAAEAALRDAAQRLTTGVNPAAFRASATAVVGTNANGIAFWNAYNWASATSLSSNLNQVAAQPVFVLERWGTTNRYRVTARGIGGVNAAAVILQAEYQCTGAGTVDCP